MFVKYVLIHPYFYGMEFDTLMLKDFIGSAAVLVCGHKMETTPVILTEYI